MSKLKSLAAIEAAIAAHPKGKPLNEQGQLIPDSTPIAPPIGYKKQPSMVEIIREQIRQASEEAGRAGYDTLEEAEDFDIGDGQEPYSQYEQEDAQEVPISVLRERQRQALADEAEKAAEAAKPGGGGETPAEAAGEASGGPKAGKPA